MNKTIKTRNVVKDIKVLDKKAGLAAVYNAHAKVRDVAEKNEPSNQQYESGNDYAQDKVEQSASAGSGVAQKVAADKAKKTMDNIRDARGAEKRGGQGAQSARNTNIAARRQVNQAVSRRAAQRTAARTGANTRRAATGAGKQTTSTATKKSIKQKAKGTVKTAAKPVKTARATAGKAVKTPQQMAQVSKVTAKVTQIATRNAAQIARAATRTTIAAGKVAAKGIMTFVKMATLAIKSLVVAIAAGGGTAAAVILIICLVGLVATSAFGIFFAGGDMGDGNPTLREVVAQINREHQDKIDEIKATSPHDELMISGSKAPWKEVLAVYAVYTTTNTDALLDVITLDAQRQKLLRKVYWDMNVLDYRMENREYTEIVAIVQDDGTLIEETQVYTRRTLYITQSTKSADDMATVYGFNARQRDLLAEMLSSQFASAWQSVLYGTHSSSGDIVEAALSQLGNPGGAPYWSWYGFSGRVEWCACFVSWCASECGYLEAGIIPKHSYCQTGINWFRDAGGWQQQGSGYIPKPGDIIYFDWGDGGDADHVGIVQYVEGGYVHTVEGNSSDVVRQQSYSINNSAIVGYATPNY